VALVLSALVVSGAFGARFGGAGDPSSTGSPAKSAAMATAENAARFRKADTAPWGSWGLGGGLVLAPSVVTFDVISDADGSDYFPARLHPGSKKRRGQAREI
jgi:hypothetical protein